MCFQILFLAFVSNETTFKTDFIGKRFQQLDCNFYLSVTPKYGRKNRQTKFVMNFWLDKIRILTPYVTYGSRSFGFMILG